MNKEIRMFEIDEDLEIRNENDKNVLKGYGIKWEKLSVPMWGYQEKFARNAFTKYLNKRNILSFWNHNNDILLGNTANNSLSLVEDDKGLRFEIILPDTTQAQDVRRLIKDKYSRGMSVGFRSVIDEWDETDPNMIIRTIKEAELFELSPTHSPAYPQTYVSARKMSNAYEEYRNKKINIIKRKNLIRKNLIKNEEVRV